MMKRCEYQYCTNACVQLHFGTLLKIANCVIQSQTQKDHFWNYTKVPSSVKSFLQQRSCH